MTIPSAQPVKQIPLSADIGLRVEAISGPISYDGSVTTAPNSSYVHLGTSYNATDTTAAVSYTRTGDSVSVNPTTALLSKQTANQPSFSAIGLATAPARINNLSTSAMDVDAGGGTPQSFTYTDPGNITTLKAIVDSNLGYSTKALHVILSGNNVVTVAQGGISGSLNQWFNASAWVKVVSSANINSFTLKCRDATNALVSSVAISLSAGNNGKWLLYNTSLRLTGGASTNLKWSLEADLAAAGTLEFYVTNAALTTDAAWLPQFAPSAAGPTTRGADTTDITGFYTTTDMWSIDFQSFAPLTSAIAGASQLQYLFSTYTGVQGSSIFVNQPNTITWRVDNNGTFQDVVATTGGPSLGLIPWRVWFRTVTNGGNFDRTLAIQRLDTGALIAPVTTTFSISPYFGTTMKLGRDNADANRFEGYIGKLVSWSVRSNKSMARVVNGWPVP